MKKDSLLVVLLIVLATNSFAQQDKLITHFMYDKMSLNPGETGIDEGICGVMMYRNQWDKVNGAPNSVLLNVEANMNRFFPGGIGISFYHDQIGFNRQNNVLLNYSYPLRINGVGTLGIGVGVGLMNFSMSPEWVPPTTLNDGTLPTAYSANNLDLNFGVYLKGAADYYVGLSSTHLSQSRFAGGLNVTTYDSKRHYYLMGGKTFRSIGPGDIETNLLLRTDLVKMSADINARYLWKDIAYGGLTYRTSDAIAIMLGYKPINNLTIGYSYDITINKLSSVSRGTHEIMVKYCYFLPPVPIQKSKHPRWL
ncbi:MAG TPA: type IX secretion system membrane protein PorP/SprF [Crocinitomicaceae bacterium]|nr:type IX secretion system membrane protein PorP/SprF [Crocinitomicaceae bacterium]